MAAKRPFTAFEETPSLLGLAENALALLATIGVETMADIGGFTAQEWREEIKDLGDETRKSLEAVHVAAELGIRKELARRASSDPGPSILPPGPGAQELGALRRSAGSLLKRTRTSRGPAGPAQASGQVPPGDGGAPGGDRVPGGYGPSVGRG